MLAALCLSALLAGQSADTVTTARLLHHGYREANPMLPRGTTGIVAVKASVTTGIALAGWRLRRQHPRAAVAVWLLGATVGGVSAAHNLRVR